MANAEITWNIVNLECLPTQNNYTNVVKTIHWECSGSYTAQSSDPETQGSTYSARVYGSINVQQPSESFIDYNNLTKEQVLAWVWEEVNKNLIERDIQDQIDKQLTPPTITPTLPWA